MKNILVPVGVAITMLVTIMYFELWKKPSLTELSPWQDSAQNATPEEFFEEGSASRGSDQSPAAQTVADLAEEKEGSVENNSQGGENSSKKPDDYLPFPAEEILQRKLAPLEIERIPILEEGLKRKLTDQEIAGIFMLEKELDRKLTLEEIEQKPEEASWYAWFYFLSKRERKIASNGPVNFFGKVVDPNGEPLQGVGIEAEISYYDKSVTEAMDKEVKNSVGNSKKEILIETDNEGRFKIQGERGSGLMVSKFEKVGWELAGRKNYWGFNFMPKSPNLHHPDSEKPVEFVMKEVK